MPVITSRQHPMVKQCRAILRGDDERLLLDGWHLAGEALASGLPMTWLAVDTERSVADPHLVGARRCRRGPYRACHQGRPRGDVARSVRLGRGRRVRASGHRSARAAGPRPTPRAHRARRPGSRQRRRPGPVCRCRWRHGRVADGQASDPVELEGPPRVDGERFPAAGAAGRRGRRSRSRLAARRRPRHRRRRPRRRLDVRRRPERCTDARPRWRGRRACRSACSRWPTPVSACRCEPASNRSTSRWPPPCSSTRRRASAPASRWASSTTPCRPSIRTPFPWRSGCARARSTRSSGRTRLLDPGRPLREMIERDVLQSIILWGPPGTGKTTLARLIADAHRRASSSPSARCSPASRRSRR